MPKIEKIKTALNEDPLFSGVVKVGNHYHFSGIISTTTEHWDIVKQTADILKRMKIKLSECGLTFKDVYSVTIMVRGSLHIHKKESIDKLHAKAFKDVEIMPRRTMFAVVDLPHGALIEMVFDAVDQKEYDPSLRRQ
jgi:enamine deaminase RidA (YjgF/YER057c/UK114 family)